MQRSGIFHWVAGLVALVALWYGVFMLTGLLWWNAPRGNPVSPPRPIAIAVPTTAWVDLGAYQRTHPFWLP